MAKHADVREEEQILMCRPGKRFLVVVFGLGFSWSVSEERILLLVKGALLNKVLYSPGFKAKKERKEQHGQRISSHVNEPK